MELTPPHPVLLEVCVTSLDYAVAAERAGAHRIELCSDLDCGGVTPSLRLMKAVRERLRIPVHVLIRPRPGDFVYSEREFSAMRQAIDIAKELKMDGLVFGILERNHRVDVTRTGRLVAMARPLPVTFHRAFDETPSESSSLEAVIETGAARLLTSGHRARVTDALSTVARLVKQAGDRLIIMPGSGINPANVLRVIRATRAREVHGSLLTPALRAEKKADGAERGWQTERYYRRVRRIASRLGAVATR